jgi:hypothetical protein
MHWINILVGLAVLFFGRRLFWLFVGGIGFIVGFDIANQVLQGQSPWLILLIAVVVGVLGAIVSIFLQRIVIGIAGFFSGGYFLSALAMTQLHDKTELTHWIAFVVGGIIGAMLIMLLLNPALIFLSSLVGATAVAQNVSLNQSQQALLFFVLLILGIIVQTTQYARQGKPPQRRDVQ